MQNISCPARLSVHGLAYSASVLSNHTRACLVDSSNAWRISARDAFASTCVDDDARSKLGSLRIVQDQFGMFARWVPSPPSVIDLSCGFQVSLASGSRSSNFRV